MVIYEQKKEGNSVGGVEGVEGCLCIFHHTSFLTFMTIPEPVHNSEYQFLWEGHKLFQNIVVCLIHLMLESTHKQWPLLSISKGNAKKKTLRKSQLEWWLQPQGKTYSWMPNQGLVRASQEELNFEYAIWDILKGTYFRTAAENWPFSEQWI